MARTVEPPSGADVRSSPSTPVRAIRVERGVARFVALAQTRRAP
jgi:hypothetical protein